MRWLYNKCMPAQHFIYVLRDEKGVEFYVGRTTNCKRRLNEHHRSFGQLITMEVVEEVSLEDWAEAEKRWIALLRESGFELKNISPGGFEMGDATRLKLSLATTGRPVTWSEKIKAALKGRAPKWSADGASRVASSQFKPGRVLSEEIEQKRKAAQLAYITSVPHDVKSKTMTKANKSWWDNATPEQRAARTARMNAGRDPEKVRAAARRNGQLSAEKNRELAGRTIKKFWDDMTPEYRAEYLARRTARIVEAKASKKAANTAT